MARMLDGMERLLRGETPPPPAATKIGMRLASFAPGEAVPVYMQQSSLLGQEHGVLVLSGSIDEGITYRIRRDDGTTLGEDESYTTLEIKTNFLRPVRAGRVSARARVRNAGRTVGLVECEVTTADGKVAAYAVSTCMTLRGEAAAGR